MIFSVALNENQGTVVLLVWRKVETWVARSLGVLYLVSAGMSRSRERRRWWSWIISHPRLCLLALSVQSAAFVPSPYGPASQTATDTASAIGSARERLSCSKQVAGTSEMLLL